MASAAETDESHMRVALEEAEAALLRREVPVGCIFVDAESGRVVTRGGNRTNETYNPTTHAELVAAETYIQSMPEADREEALADLRRCVVYVSVEPCIMCAGALARLGVQRVVFGCANDVFGGCGSVADVHKKERFPATAYHTPFTAHGGVLREEAVQLLRRFYARSNVRAPRNRKSGDDADSSFADEVSRDSRQSDSSVASPCAKRPRTAADARDEER